jgi:hypothetical protein
MLRGAHSTGRDVSPAATRRDDAKAKKETRAKHAVLEADQQISGFDTNTLNQTSFEEGKLEKEGQAGKTKKHIAKVVGVTILTIYAWLEDWSAA